MRRRRRWSALSGTERVALYTRQSLYAVLWGFNGWTLMTTANKLDDGGHAVPLLVGGAVVTSLGFATQVTILRHQPVVQRLPWRPLVPLLAASFAYVATAEVSLPENARFAASQVVIMSLALSIGTLRNERVAAGLIALGALLFAIAGETALSAVGGVIAAAAGLFTARASMWVLGIVIENDQARHVQTQLAVVEERLRFSRDVHDVMGRRLSTIAVQAELAATLAARGDDGAAARMLDVRGVAHEALREARELARGYRSTDFTKEMEGAQSLLRSAGIDVRLSVGDMPRAWQEAAGWVLREGVTNVLRHSTASVVDVTYGDERLMIANDGARPDASADGSGLRGLRERLVPLGATLVAGPEEGGRWVVTAQLPGTGPVSATTR